MQYRFFLMLLCVSVLVGTAFAYIAPTTENQPIIVESDASFYGSDQGQVTIDLNLTNVQVGGAKDFFIRVRGLEGTNTFVKEISYNGVKVENTIYPIAQQSKTKLSLSALDKKPMKIKLIFDPQELGFGREFTIRLETKDGTLVADLDPFLSGYSYRRQLTITNNYVGTINDTNSVAVYHLTDELGAKALANCYDVRVTYGDTTEIDSNVIGNCQSDANLYVPLYASIGNGASDNGYYLYYGNAGASAPSAKNLVLPAPDSTGVVMCHLNNSLVNESGSACTNSSMTFSATSVAGGYGVVNDAETDYIDTGVQSLGESARTYEFWVRLADTGKQRLAGVSNAGKTEFWQFVVEDAQELRVMYFTGGGFTWDIDTAVIPTTGEYIHLAMTCGSAGIKFWYNGNVIGSDASTACPNISGNNFYVGRIEGWTEGANVSAYFDEIRVSNYQKVFFPQSAVNTTAEQPTISLGAEEQASAVAWNSFAIRPYFDVTRTLDMNIFTDQNFYLDFNLTLPNFNTSDINFVYNVGYTGTDQNCFLTIRDDRQCGWKKETGTFTTVSSVGDTYVMRSPSEDDHAFKHSSYNVDPDQFDTKDGYAIMNTGNDWLKTLLTRANYPSVIGDSNTFYNLSFFGNFTGAIPRTMNVYDCNNDSATPTTDAGCVPYSFDSTTLLPKDDTYYSLINESGDTNNLGSVHINDDGNHWVYMNCPLCNATQYWSIAYDSENSNVDRTRNWASDSGVAGLVAFTNTLDVHLHWQSLLVDHFFQWYFEVKDDTTDYNSPVQTEQIENVNLPPIVNMILNPKINTIYSGGIDVNVQVTDPNSNSIVCDLNIVNKAGTVFTIAEGLAPVNNYCNTVINSLIYQDGNYYLTAQVREQGTTEMYSGTGQMDANFFIDNNAPVIAVYYPNGGNSFEKPLTVQIDFNVLDYQKPLYVDINYSVFTTQGTGTPILTNESTASANLICTGADFTTTQTCSYQWVINAVPDNNYMILLAVSDGLNVSFDRSDANFEIKSPPIPTESDYTQQYINPNSKQRDGNVFYNPNSAQNLTEEQKQTAGIQGMQTLLFFITLIIIASIIVLGVIVWKRR